MSDTKQFRGVAKAQENKPSSAVRDLRPLWKQVLEGIAGRNGSLFALGVFCAITLIFPSFADLLFILQLLVFWYSFWSFKKLPFKMPMFSERLDFNNLRAGTNDPGPSEGIFFFGNEINRKDQLWFSNSDMRTHVLIFGSTGSGKTETLVSIAFNSLVQGSGFIYVDGKGDNSLFAKVFGMVRKMGREDDLLIINFMTGAVDVSGPQEHVLSNTLNPFASGSSSMLTQLVTSLMDSGGSGGGDGDMWKGRAIAFVDSLMRPLVWLRDNGHLLLEAGLIRRYFPLDAIEELLFDRKVIDQNNNVHILENGLPFDIRDSLENYLATLPGYQKSEKGKQSGKAYEQHGYITMQLTKIFGSMADVYGHILRAKLAEVDFHDVVLNRRILVVLLPALEKSPDELANLGKLIIASLRAMLAGGLGDRVEGDYRDVIETKPTNSNSPYLCVLDEYGYYAVKGFAVVPAQARSLGFSVVFAGQDLPAFQKASKEEAASICANTNVKICMKLEDPQETWEFFQKTAGESYVSVARSFNKGADVGNFSYKDSLEATLDKRSRLDLLDLKDQREGEFHIFFRSEIVRASSFYASPPKVKKLKVNQFMQVDKPADQAMRFLYDLKKIVFEASSFEQEKVEDTKLAALFELLNRPSVREDEKLLYRVLNDFVEGHQDTEVIDFGDQSKNPSIFMSVPVDERLSSDFFDVEVSNLQESLLTKEKLYEVVKKINILEGRSENSAKQEAVEIIRILEKETNYASCYVPVIGTPTPLIDQYLQGS